ncbi:RES domain-containing protein [Mucilaginibacter mali]|uniref:RES domain-containing protein n=1 Tax=Mucilaginibacter mali TaxID=2740462 RepID=A0A7D4QD60_9SPHI|nr:RES domain-containing protein [Mucilaginibacter mali]QKJ32865.1 RES domain-containing protein [Mucilaginibacter mali]
MNFLEILRHQITNLPIEQPDGLSFKQTITHKIREFGEIVDSSEDLSEPVNGMTLNPEIFKKRNKILREGILDTIEIYYTGNLHGAYNRLAKFMKDANTDGYLNKEMFAQVDSSFFRIRKHNGNFPLTRPELFHIPFDLRGKVATQRYSIPGLPSLYISNSIYTAWEEMRRPDFNEIQAIKLSNNRPLQLLNLRSDIYSRNAHVTDNVSYNWDPLYAVMIWPLIAACSVKVKNTLDTFKPEYIIPQLLLQWINKSKVDGILYSSTHIDLSKSKHAGAFYNIVLPSNRLS